jgi:competence protein ComEA
MEPRKDTILTMWAVTRGELAAWAIALGCVGLWALAGHSPSRALAGVQVERAGTAAENVQTRTWRLDVNAATQAELELLPGVGRYRATSIIKEREKRGAFQNVWQLSEVPGLTPALVRRLEPLLRASAPAN